MLLFKEEVRDNNNKDKTQNKFLSGLIGEDINKLFPDIINKNDIILEIKINSIKDDKIIIKKKNNKNIHYKKFHTIQNNLLLMKMVGTLQVILEKIDEFNNRQRKILDRINL